MDLAIRDAKIIDGTGAPRYAGDIGVNDGKVVAIGQVDGRAKEEINAGGACVAPGFIDCHTHYDAQVMWDQVLSPSVYHGVTTIIGGNCGFTLAPLSGRKEDTDYLLSMLSRVEGMPLNALEEAIRPTWKSFGEYLDSLDGKIAVNTAFLAGHSAIRRCVMGERAVGHEATSDDLKKMADLLRKSIAEGAVGFSTSRNESHSDIEGDAVPSRWATDEEMLVLAAVAGEFPGTWIGLSPGGRPYGERQYKMAADLSLAAKRMVNWNVFIVSARQKGLDDIQLRMGRYAEERGAKVIGLVPATVPKSILNIRTGFVLDMIDGWHDFIHLPDDKKIAALRDPEVRARLQEGVNNTTSGSAAGIKDFGDFIIESVRSEKNARWKHRRIGEYAIEHGLSPLDGLFQLAVEEELWLAFSPSSMGADEESWALRAKLWHDRHLLVGGSDAGAHLDLLNTFAVTTHLLGEGARERGLISFEEAVRLITSAPADAFGLKGKGRIVPGADADLVVFDPTTVGCGPVNLRNDLPCGEPRLYAESVGIDHVIVNGVPVAKKNASTGRKGGKVLRSGRDTYTVPL